MIHTEHLQNVRIGRVIASWLVAVAVMSLVLLASAALGITGDNGASTAATIVAVAIGFFAGGMFSGFRAVQAPVLHGVAITLTSLVLWVIASAVTAGMSDGAAWRDFTPALTLFLLLLQLVTAVAGALVGYNIALRGEPGLSEHEPV